MPNKMNYYLYVEKVWIVLINYLIEWLKTFWKKIAKKFGYFKNFWLILFFLNTKNFIHKL